jgi:hypothetical protein
MNTQFIAKPPQAVKSGSIPKHFRQMFHRLGYIVWQIVTPFKSRPEQIDPLPEPDPTHEVTYSPIRTYGTDGHLLQTMQI